MLRYTAARLIQGILTVWCIYTATFVLMHAVDGSPLTGMKNVPEELMEQITRKYRLDQPLPHQYYNYLRLLLSGDLGLSLTDADRSVNEIISGAFPRSAVLGVMSLLVATAGGVLFGTLTAHYRNRAPDIVIMALVIVGISVPGFVLAAFLQLGLVALNEATGWTLPITGWDSTRGLLGNLPNLVMPSLVLGLGTMAYLARLMRSTMLEVMESAYIRTARSKGLSTARIFLRHQLRNAAIPLTTVLGPSIVAITTGGFVVENIFVIPGLGQNSCRPSRAWTTPHHGNHHILQLLSRAHGRRGRRGVRVHRPSSETPVVGRSTRIRRRDAQMAAALTWTARIRPGRRVHVCEPRRARLA